MQLRSAVLIKFLAILALVCPPALGVVHVPGDAPTIQQGINMASPPDTVMVAAGVYPEHIDLRSGVCVFGEDPHTTIIEGGGMAIDVVRAISVTNVTFGGFTVTGAISGGGLPGGAGVFVNFPHETVVIEDVIAVGNDFGIAVFNGYSRTGPDLIDCAIHENNYYGLSDPGNGLVSGCDIHANARAGINTSGNSCRPDIINNTIWGNSGDGYQYWNDFAPTVRNNIFALNGGYGIEERAPGTFVDPIVEYNCFFDNALGNYYDVQSAGVKNTEEEINAMPNAHSNIVTDPLLCDPPADFHLCADSPCLGAGMGGADIGAHGEGCGPCGPQEAGEEASLLADRVLLRSHPNPAGPRAMLSFELPAATQARLRVLDAAGRVVGTLWDGHMTAGRHEIAWDGRAQDGTRLPAGAYLLDLRAGQVQVAQKLILLGER